MTERKYEHRANIFTISIGIIIVLVCTLSLFA